MTLLNPTDWLLLAVAALLAAVAFVYRIRLRLRRRSATPARPDAWMRSRLPMAGLALATLLTGFALGAGYGRWSFIGLQLRQWEASVSGRMLDGPEPDRSPVTATAPAPTDTGNASATDSTAGEAETANVTATAPVDPVPAPAAADLPWAVRVGVFSERSRADRVSADLSALGLEPEVIQRQTNAGNPRYWVYAGRYPTRAEASAAAADLRARGRDALAVRMTDDRPGG